MQEVLTLKKLFRTRAEQNWDVVTINNVGAKVQNYQNVGQSESDLEYAVATVGPICCN